MVLLGTGTPGTSREINSDDDNDRTRTRNPSLLYFSDEKSTTVEK